MNQLKGFLEERRIKQTYMAKKLEKSYNMVNAYAQNRQQPRLETLMEIAKILDIDVKELIISNKEKRCQ
jgi:transcriptional regulator with XRE-family HTH domain